MPEYRRAFAPGGTFFFTLVTERRSPILCTDLGRQVLHHAFDSCLTARPFELAAIVLLPDHLHAIWTLPEDDADFSSRWAVIKARFTRSWLQSGGREAGRSESRRRRGARGVWQRRFWEHLIRDEADFERHLNYIHYNPVKHGLARCPHAWPHSTFKRWVRKTAYEEQWLCSCDGRAVVKPDFAWANDLEME